MATSPNNAHACNHTLILGGSGSGKTRWLSKNADIKNAKRVFLWDPEDDHRAIHCSTLREYRAAVVRGIQINKPFRLAFSGACNGETFAGWCAIVWAALNGDVTQAVIVEEIADVTTPGKAADLWGQIVRKSRKYNTRCYVVSQRPQECDKTTVSQCPNKWVGVLNTDADRKAVSGILSVSPDALKVMHNTASKLHYYFKEAGPHDAKLLHFNPK